MKKTKEYRECRFSAETLREVTEVVEKCANQANVKEIPHLFLTVEHDNTQWEYDTKEEFFADFSKYCKYARFVIKYDYKFSLAATFYERRVNVCVDAPDRATIETIFNVFEKHRENSRLEPLPKPPPPPPPPPPVVFIGHGRNPSWRDLKDHLRDKHGVNVTAYETGARAGHSIRDILEEMVTGSSFALLVFTGEDEQGDKSVRARQNVVHETGLFQGRLGFARAIILLEEGVEEFSNMQGVQHIKFSKNNIKEVFGEVIALLRREFKSAD